MGEKHNKDCIDSIHGPPYNSYSFCVKTDGHPIELLIYLIKIVYIFQDLFKNFVYILWWISYEPFVPIINFKYDDQLKVHRTL